LPALNRYVPFCDSGSGPVFFLGTEALPVLIPRSSPQSKPEVFPVSSPVSGLGPEGLLKDRNSICMCKDMSFPSRYNKFTMDGTSPVESDSLLRSPLLPLSCFGLPNRPSRSPDLSIYLFHLDTTLFDADGVLATALEMFGSTDPSAVPSMAPSSAASAPQLATSSNDGKDATVAKKRTQVRWIIQLDIVLTQLGTRLPLAPCLDLLVTFCVALKHFPPGQKGNGRRGVSQTWDLVYQEFEKVIRLLAPSQIALKPALDSDFSSRKLQDRMQVLVNKHKAEQAIYKTGNGVGESSELVERLENQLDAYATLLEDLEVAFRFVLLLLF